MNKKVQVSQTVEVTIDESRFDEAFLTEFRKNFYDFKTVDDHIEHLAQLAARGIISPGSVGDEFIEGYGSSREMGIRTGVVDQETEILEQG